MTRNTRQSRELNEANRQRFTAVFFAVIAIMSIFSWLVVYNIHTLAARRLAYYGSFVVIAIVLVASWFTMIAYENYRNVEKCENQPPSRDMPTGRPQFESETRAPDSRLVSRDPERPRRIIIAGQNIRIRNWRRLARTLAHYNYHFTRDVIAEAQAFTSLSKNWPKIHAEFIRLGWVVGNEMTPEGVAIMKADYPPTFMSELPDAPAHR